MTIREKLALHDELEKRNNERIRNYLDNLGACGAIEPLARAILGSLDILAQQYAMERGELLGLLCSTLCTMQRDGLDSEELKTMGDEH